MKKVLLCGINARFSHSSYALLCLKHACNGGVQTVEFSINDNVERIVREIALIRPDAIGFSCYIWNIEIVLKAASSIKKILPHCFILLGGPEVSYDSEEMMRSNLFVDMIIRGEGEIPFTHFMRRFGNGEEVLDTPSAAIRDGASIVTNPSAPPYDMNLTPFMYADLGAFANKIIYYETSRGCPLGCAYCMSAGTKMSYLSLERVQSELEHFIKAGVQQVKLVDRTFNYPPARSFEILKTIVALSLKYPDSRTNFHLEITAPLLNENMLALIRSAKTGLLHLEVGIQSTNPETLRAVSRGLDTQKLLETARMLCAMDNICVHADLIAGLPLESYDSFKKSFNDTFSLNPAELQLGFLKLLKGSRLRIAAGEYGIEYTDYPPYEVLRTSSISCEELSLLHMIEKTLDLLYNSKNCLNTLHTLIPMFGSPFVFFESFAQHLEAAGYFARPQKFEAVFEQLIAFAQANRLDTDTLSDSLALDWLSSGRPHSWPPICGPQYTAAQKSIVRDFFSNTANIEKYLPHYAGLSPKKINDMCCIYFLRKNTAEKSAALFDYGKKQVEPGFIQFLNIF